MIYDFSKSDIWDPLNPLLMRVETSALTAQTHAPSYWCEEEGINVHLLNHTQ